MNKRQLETEPIDIPLKNSLGGLWVPTCLDDVDHLSEDFDCPVAKSSPGN